MKKQFKKITEMCNNCYFIIYTMSYRDVLREKFLERKLGYFMMSVVNYRFDVALVNPFFLEKI